MQAKEISELEPQELTDESLLVVYRELEGAGQASLENVKKYIGVTLDDDVTESYDDNGLRTTTWKLKDASKTVEVGIKDGVGISGWTTSESTDSNGLRSTTLHSKLTDGTSTDFSVKDGVGFKVDEVVVTESEESGGTNVTTIPSTDGKSIVLNVKNGVSAGFATPTASVTAIEQDEEPSVTVTEDEDSPFTAKQFDFAFKLPKGAGITKVEQVYEEGEVDNSLVDITYGYSSDKERITIPNGKDGFGFFTFDVNDEGHLMLYTQSPEWLPDFYISEDRHLMCRYVEDDSTKFVTVDSTGAKNMDVDILESVDTIASDDVFTLTRDGAAYKFTLEQLVAAVKQSL